MKIFNQATGFLKPAILMLFFMALTGTMTAQDSTAQAANQDPALVAKMKPVKNTFEGVWIIDNQTVMVPIKGTFEMDIMHRFGVIKNGYEDFAGLFAPSNIRLGFAYVPIQNLLVGFSITKSNMTWEGYAKYAILQQVKGRIPVSVTYFGDIALDSRKSENFVHSSDRAMYFNQLIIARKITSKFSLQLAPSHTHVNTVPGYYYAPGKYRGMMNHDHFAIAASGRYKVRDAMAVIVNFDQPLTQHRFNNPRPNLSFGIEMTTSGHAFQIFMGNYSSITPQRNNFYNQNNLNNIGEFLIGFNITRLSNF
jgi:hypothetical protein